MVSFLQKTDKLLLIPILSSIISALFITGLFLFLSSRLSSKLPLFYSLPWGQSQLATKQQFLILPATLILITLVNTFITWELHPSQTVLKRVLMLSLFLTTLIIFISTIKILLIFL